jgi:hypothetical protein
MGWQRGYVGKALGKVEGYTDHLLNDTPTNSTHTGAGRTDILAACFDCARTCVSV